MGIWSRLFGGDRSPERLAADSESSPVPAAGEASRPGADTAPAGSAGAGAAEMANAHAGAEPATERRPEWLVRLERLGQVGGADADEAVAVLRQTQGTSEQSLALQAVLRVLGAGAPHESLRAMCAAILVDRGQADRALELVRQCRSVEAMMLAADLYASRGELTRALSTVERVLARNIDTPGARERHEQWGAQLGRTTAREPRKRDDAATVIAASGPKTPFRLLREVARGGAGTVYQAEDELLGRRVAYKLYHRAAGDRAQIEREARAAAMLEGPGVVRVYDADPGAGWLAMEWLGRGSLRDALKGDDLGSLLPIERWALPLLATLARIHQAGIVHADLKPANVFFRAAGEPVLGDFGISRPRGEPSLGGTPGYLSPERLGGAPADPRDDVYAVGRILEDVVAALEQAAAAGKLGAPHEERELERWSEVARACLAEGATRPADAAAVLARVQAAGRPPD